ncbi:hypothetical protein [Variovorax paradoxus]|uniref:hypothetical protein n=1 Tax=Variovorax paradoxus TaxID=34073 RepID=UPI0033965DAB
MSEALFDLSLPSHWRYVAYVDEDAGGFSGSVQLWYRVLEVRSLMVVRQPSREAAERRAKRLANDKCVAWVKDLEARRPAI